MPPAHMPVGDVTLWPIGVWQKEGIGFPGRKGQPTAGALSAMVGPGGQLVRALANIRDAPRPASLRRS